MPVRAIKAIFFTRFHHEKGSHVLHQVPEGSITPSNALSALRQPLFDLESVSTYLIPVQQFCDRLIHFIVNHQRVIGYPVCIRDSKYERNEFLFNFALVIDADVVDWGCYGEVVKKMGKLLRALEEQGEFLSREEMGIWDDEDYRKGKHFANEDANGRHSAADDILGRKEDSGMWDIGPVPGGSKVFALCEMVLEDLNNYCECMIPIDESNTINLKLFPTRLPPAPVYAHHVPLLTISPRSLTTPISSDLTLTRILPFIDGVHSVSHIAQLADTDLSLTRKAVQHLIYYNCALVLDVFSFGAIYAPTAEIGGFITDSSVGDECVRYVKVPRFSLGRGVKVGSESERSRDDKSSLSSEAGRSDNLASTLTAADSEAYTGKPGDEELDFDITHDKLILLMTSLRQGLTLKNWCLENVEALQGIDVRRFITFGVIKGFLYRVHRYAVLTSTPSSTLPVFGPPLPPESVRAVDSDEETVRGKLNNMNLGSRQAVHKPSMASTKAPQAGASGLREEDITRLNSLESGSPFDVLPLIKFLDGMHSFDEICTELKMSENAVEKKIKSIGDVQFVWK